MLQRQLTELLQGSSLQEIFVGAQMITSGNNELEK